MFPRKLIDYLTKEKIFLYVLPSGPEHTDTAWCRPCTGEIFTYNDKISEYKKECQIAIIAHETGHISDYRQDPNLFINNMDMGVKIDVNLRQKIPISETDLNTFIDYEIKAWNLGLDLLKNLDILTSDITSCAQFFMNNIYKIKEVLVDE